jgi:LCP family protein required for cell wall assembly
MPNLNSPKKHRSHDSIDGIISQPRRQLGTPTYYTGKGKNLPGLGAQSAPAENQKLGDFRQPNTGSNFGTTAARPSALPTALQTPKKPKKRRLRGWWKNRSKKFKFAFIFLTILLVLGGIFGVRLYAFLHSVFHHSVNTSKSAALSDTLDLNQLKTEGDGRLNILVLGRGGTENDAPDLTDTMMIASLDLNSQTVSLLSIARDTWVNPGSSGSMKINAVFSTGKQRALNQGKSMADAEAAGAELSLETMRTISGVPIHRYVLVDFVAFRDVVNALGGVDVNVPQAINDYYTNYFFKAGQQHMDGARALQYARSRHGSARGDFDRTQRQRQLLVAMRQKANSTGFIANPLRISSLANAIQKNVRTDLSLDEAKALFTKTKGMPDSSIVSLDLALPEAPLVMTGTIGDQSIVRPVAGLFDYSGIRNYARTNMLDPFLKQEAPTVAVYNASGNAGAAATVANVLASYGYKVLVKDTATHTQPQTMVIKQTQVSKPVTDHYLSIRFNSSIGSSIPDGVIPAAAATTSTTHPTTTASPPQADYVIILGTNYVKQNGPTW